MRVAKFSALLLVLVLAFSLVACTGNTGAASSQSNSMTVIAPPSDAAPPVSDPEPLPLEQAFLTGLEKGADYPENQRICSVMVINDPGARPTRGLSDAKIVVEMTVEYSITRLMGIFENYQTMPTVGPMRSARDQFFQLIIPFQSFYVHDGPSHPSHPVNTMMDQYEYKEYDLGIANAWRDQGRLSAGYKTEYTEYTDGAHITQKVEQGGFDPARTYNSPIFYFGRYDEAPRVPEEGSIQQFGIVHQPYFRTLFAYNGGSAKYEMNMYNSSRGVVEPYVDENNGQQLSFDNVLVLFAPIDVHPNTAPENLPKLDYSMGGGFYFTQGGWERILWTKGAADQPLRLMNIDKSEAPVVVNPGTTYLAVVNHDRAEDFYAGLLNGTSWTEAETGKKGQVTADLAD